MSRSRSAFCTPERCAEVIPNDAVSLEEKQQWTSRCDRSRLRFVDVLMRCRFPGRFKKEKSLLLLLSPVSLRRHIPDRVVVDSPAPVSFLVCMYRPFPPHEDSDPSISWAQRRLVRACLLAVCFDSCFSSWNSTRSARRGLRWRGSETWGLK